MKVILIKKIFLVFREEIQLKFLKEILIRVIFIKLKILSHQILILLINLLQRKKKETLLLL